MSLTAPVVVLHSTEGNGWPAYAGGSVAPTLTLWAVAPGDVRWRQHFPVNESARALMNKAGGVQTNTAGAVQVELVGTCDPTSHRNNPSWMYWPEAPDWALAAVATFLAWMRAEWGLPLQSTTRPWLAYPSSYGNSAARMSFGEWQSFSGVCGHQHVPENDHGDPGNLPIARILSLAVGGASQPIPSQEHPTQEEDPMASYPADLYDRLVSAQANAQLAKARGDQAVNAASYVMQQNALIIQALTDLAKAQGVNFDEVNAKLSALGAAPDTTAPKES
jgi:hypothetical protein